MRSLALVVAALAVANAATVTVSWGIQNETAQSARPTIVASGDTIIFTLNQDNSAHTVYTIDDPGSASFDSGPIAAGGTYSHTFTTKGLYLIRCAYHSMMMGTVLVGGKI